MMITIDWSVNPDADLFKLTHSNELFLSLRNWKKEEEEFWLIRNRIILTKTGQKWTCYTEEIGCDFVTVYTL